MFAVIRTGGKQYIVSPGQTITIEKLPHEEGADVVFDEVLLTADDAGAVRVGTPTVPGVSVHGTVVEQRRTKKIIVFKYKPKKRMRKKKGHRQPVSVVTIDKIVDGAKKPAAAKKKSSAGKKRTASNTKKPATAKQ